ncbi:MAG: polysaccharide biosynthesis protein [Xanthomarina sp.]|uniref:Polysaccharide biosynthesis protein n=1 Tax=Xanthomarina gelatinilytica TaxID=1137281 RepID=M7MLM3_9FLAO|nr:MULTISPECIES: polysaccharide biosynthesis C-terminal domain-containing protein [Xanthomarina]EMQ96001.1 Polysaccharide biosynthesis protein [Xanthomarina gelatinilytica]MAL22538.1 polysaccharide biosynthesis protein [Xanthomarina sp.]MBF61081.1 polysaccharide biosynthesis protein [Xanthomarina sp.]HAB28510.1 polysaccharide biosynthesis protein [Xanthomarina gelatinilytica]
MSTLKSLFKQTFIYGLATVLPRMLSFLLVRLHTDESVLKSVADYGDVSLIYSYFVLFNVILAYGMETAFFRFFHKEDNKAKVVGTSSISLIVSSVLFFVLALAFQNQIANVIDIKAEYINLVIWILLLDALVIIPFAWLRANGKPIKYAFIKILNVAINLGLNLFLLLWLKDLATESSLLASIYRPNFEINYIFIANLVASAVTLLIMLPFYFKITYTFNTNLWKQMIRYAFPVLIAGVAFSINETFDRILLDKLLPENIAKTEIGMYSACYKLGMFMTLFVTAYKLGVEPFFFSHANTENPKKNYARILEYFVIFGSVILLGVVVFADVLKVILIGDEAYWQAMLIVPIILLANLCLGIYHNLSVWYKITDRTKFGAYISVFGAFLTLLLNIWLIPKISYVGSALATLAAYASMMMISYYFGKKYYPIPYNLKKISVYLLLSIGLSAITFYGFRGNYVVGISALIVFLGLVFQLEKNDLRKLLKQS